MSAYDLLAKESDLLKNTLLWGILLRFRQEQIAFVGGVSKMYNIINISELDMHTHTVFSGKIWIHIGL